MRNWIRDNIKQGNILRMDANDLEEGNQTVKPEANITFDRVFDINANMLITIDGSESLPGDEINFMLEATAEVTVSFDGDAAPGGQLITAGGVGAVKLVNGGTINNPFFVSYAPLT